jgi:DeoR C terminal sensor domain
MLNVEKRKHNRRDLQRERQRILVSYCISSPSGEISYEDVQDQYLVWEPDARSKADRVSQFRNDCKTLVENYNQLSETILDLFFLPLPEIVFEKKKKRLKITTGRRPIVVRMNSHPDSMTLRKNLARFVCQADWPQSNVTSLSGTPLIPTQGARVYAGVGTTVCFIFRELFALIPDLSTLTVFTTSFEIAGLFYYRHDKAGAETSGLRVRENLDIDRDEGAILSFDRESNLEVDVAIISCHSVHNKTFRSTISHGKMPFTWTMLEKASRIVVVLENWKIGRGDGLEMTIPSVGNKPILVVSDAEESVVRPHLPPGVQFLHAK